MALDLETDYDKNNRILVGTKKNKFEQTSDRLNMELVDLQSLFGLRVHSCILIG